MQHSNGQYRLICGLEIHAELKTQSKMFCGCVNDPFHAKQPNMYTCPTCLGMPGGLPVPNKKAIENTILLGLSLGATIQQFSKFDRKNYFYPDLPKGYQISQFDIPFCKGGEIHTSIGPVHLTRIHLEEDTGKLIHDTVAGERVSLIDFNRGGVPLVEIVSEPEIHSAKQAKEYGKSIRATLRYLGIADCDMEQGGMRLEANISLISNNEPEGTLPDYKVEVKNINSFRFMEQAIEYEIVRQAHILDQGKLPTQETRGWDAEKGQTYSQRTKEDAADYRYFPDPDIPPIVISDEHLKKLQTQVPELPHVIVKRWQDDYAIPQDTASVLIESQEGVQKLEDIFKEAKSQGFSTTAVAQAIRNKRIKYSIDMSPQLVIKTFADSVKTDAVSDDELTALIMPLLTAHPDAVRKYAQGEKQIIGFFIGQVMRAAEKKLDVKQVTPALIQLLEKTT